MTREELIYGLLKKSGYGLSKKAVNYAALAKLIPRAGTRAAIGAGAGALKGMTDELDPYSGDTRTGKILKNLVGGTVAGVAAKPAIYAGAAGLGAAGRFGKGLSYGLRRGFHGTGAYAGKFPMSPEQAWLYGTKFMKPGGGTAAAKFPGGILERLGTVAGRAAGGYAGMPYRTARDWKNLSETGKVMRMGGFAAPIVGGAVINDQLKQEQPINWHGSMPGFSF